MTPSDADTPRCPTCGTPVEVAASDEGTNYYRPLDATRAAPGLREAVQAFLWSEVEDYNDALAALAKAYDDSQPATASIDVERLARALHGTGDDPNAESWTWGSCLNWAPGWGDECGPDKHMDEARDLLRRLSSAKDPAE